LRISGYATEASNNLCNFSGLFCTIPAVELFHVTGNIDFYQVGKFVGLLEGSSSCRLTYMK